MRARFAFDPVARTARQTVGMTPVRLTNDADADAAYFYFAAEILRGEFAKAVSSTREVSAAW